MKKLLKRYQYWWRSGDGYSVEEFDKTEELLGLIAAYPSSDFYLTERVDYLPSMDFKEPEKETK